MLLEFGLFIGLVVLDLGRSPHAKLHGVPVSAVRMDEGFWAERRRVNVEVSIPTLLELLEQNGAVDNFRRLSGRKQVVRRGPLYTDSDIYKWMEAVAFVLQSGPNPKLRAQMDTLAGEVLAAQEASGYLNTYYTRENLDKRHGEMTRGHELYCLGHMLQAGIAYFRATGDRRLMDGGIRMVNYLMEHFGPGKKPIMEGHPEIELALIELYRTTGDKRFLEFAAYILGGDERNKLSQRDLVYLFTGKPFTARTRLEGHAVRAMYAASGATDYFLETGDAGYWKTLRTLWDDMVMRKMYVTGGIGSRAQGEAFGEPYELPNQQAYTESCAAIGNMIWNYRMLAATGDAKYTDVLERALYNSVNSGISLEGNLYCYRNPLELLGNPEDKIRNPWYATTCCPPNLERILASLPGYMYSTSKDGLYVNLYHSSLMSWKLEDGTELRVTQRTRYPWDEKVDLTVAPAAAKEFTLYLRVPGWSSRAAITVNGAPVPGAPAAGQYFPIKRAWKAGDQVSVALDMAVRVTAANRRVREDLGKVAVERGPLVYCMEQIDQPQGIEWHEVTLTLRKDPGTGFQVKDRTDVLGGITVLQHEAAVDAAPSELYVPLEQASSTTTRRTTATLIPYYTFHNRGITAMQVWIPFRVHP